MSVPQCLPRVLVLLASCNGARYIRQQLESIFAQQGAAVEVLVSDDASSDSTLQIVEEFQGSGRLRLLDNEIRTGSAARNFARLFREADIQGFDYIALSDQDDIWLPNKLRHATDSLAAAGAGGYSCSVLARWPDGREAIFRQSPRLRSADYLFEGGGQGCSFVITASLFQDLQKLFRTRPDLTSSLIYHDWAIYALARVQGVSWIFDAEPFVIYRQHGNNDTGARTSLVGIRKRLHMLRDGRYATQISTVCRLCLEISPHNPFLLEWAGYGSASPRRTHRIRKALFCASHGRRRHADRVLTAAAAIAGWI